jgi:hypothetical protein
LERGLKPLPNELLALIIKIMLTTNYQLLLNCNKVHRARRLIAIINSGVAKGNNRHPHHY